MRVVAWIADRLTGDGIRQAWRVVYALTPHGHWIDLWRPDAAHLASAALFLGALGLLYLFAGYGILARRDV
jgi:hypothetical protein